MKLTLSSSPQTGCFTRTLILVLGVMLSARLLPGVQVSNIFAALGTALVITFLDSLVRPILQVVAFPFILVTMGLFLFIINGAVILMADGLMGEAFEVHGLGPAVLMSLIITALNYLVEWLNKRSLQKPYEEPRQDDDHFDEYEEIK